MKRLWVLVAVALVSLLAAFAVAGRPSTVPSDVVIGERPAPTTTTTSPPRTDPSPAPSTEPPTRSPTTVPDTSEPPETSATDVVDTEPDPPPTSTRVVAPAGLRVVVVNGTNQPGLGASIATILNSLGYANTLPTDAINKDAPVSTIYFADGFRREAELMAESVQLDPASVIPIPDQPIAVEPVAGDVWLLVGADRVP